MAGQIAPTAVRSAGARTARSEPFEWLARAGFVARGLIYLIVGVLALELALGVGGTTTNQQGALRTIARQSFGTVLLGIVAVALFGYALWRLVHAALGGGPESSDNGLERVGALGSGIVYGAIGVLAIEILAGSSSSSGGAPKATAGVLAWPGGVVLVVIAGLVMFAVGVYQGHRGVTHDFLKDSRTEQMSPKVRRAVKWLGTVGHLARMVVFGMIGVFLIVSAVDYNPGKAVGLDGALAKLAQSSPGPLLLGIVAAGLIAFAVYSFSDARYRRL